MFTADPIWFENKYPLAEPCVYKLFQPLFAIHSISR